MHSRRAESRPQKQPQAQDDLQQKIKSAQGRD